MFFELGISKLQINAVKEETAKIVFNLKNTSDKIFYCLSYRFQSFWQDKIVDQFKPHEYFLMLNPNEEKIQEFGEVDFAKTYLAGNTAPGDYTIKVEIRYFESGSDKVQVITGEVNVELIGEVKSE